MEVLGVIDLPGWLISLLLLTITIYVYGIWPYSVLQRHGIQHSPVKPYFGNVLEQVGHDFMGQFDAECKNKFGKIWGMYEMRTPSVVFHDPEDIKQISVKQFQSFADRRHIPLRGVVQHSVFDAKGADWKRMRSLLTPFFTTGKLKQKSVAVNRCCDNLVRALDGHRESGNSWEAKAVASCYAMDTIAATGFGLQLDSAADPNDPYIVHGRKVDDITAMMKWFMLVGLLPFTRKPIESVLGVTMFPEGLVEFFTDITYKAIEKNQESAKMKEKKVPDFIDAMLKAHMEELDYESKKDLAELSDDKLENMRRKALSKDEMVANSILLFLAGFDTTATALSFLLYMLATNPECQEKAYQEVLEVLGETEPNYENVSKMEYTEMCLNETLRIHPPVFRYDRLCTADTEIGGVVVPKDGLVTIPVWAIHHDPEHWPDPEKFNPERFTADAVTGKHPYTFLPFGNGPRMCIGSRLAILEIKMAIAKVLMKYKLVTNEMTQIPVKLKKQTFFMQTENGMWLSVEPR